MPAGKIKSVYPRNALKVTMTGKSAFVPGSAVLNPEFLPALEKIGSVVKTYGKMTVNVIGHPDAKGTHAERVKLTDRESAHSGICTGWESSSLSCC